MGTSREKTTRQIKKIMADNELEEDLDRWHDGIKFESIAKTEFDTMHNCKILLGGLFIDFNLLFLAASPDYLN
ncbi:Exonuclease [Aphis craccivora]|uniref:Exonuclease n=1 Tax=Aphis craccivora TaxID=307492 RepID=A0A6G0Z7K1_APHCR|nr:Exonuclease [Aphis craccivora]